MTETTVAILGAGPLGRWLAQAAARAGFRVLLEDVMPSNLTHAREDLRLRLGPEAQPSVSFVGSIEDAVREADLAIDCVPDELESKLEILWLLDRMAPPRAIFATPTRHLSITDLARCTYRPTQCIAMNADATRLESESDTEMRLVAAPETSESTILMVSEFWRKLGFLPRVSVEENTAASAS